MPESYSTRVARDLHMISALTRRVLEQGTEDAKCEVSFTQFAVLKWLATSQSRKAGDVARYLSVSAPAATQILTRLKEKGLVRGRANRDDRRAEDLDVTARARALIESHDQVKLRSLETVLEAMPDAERRDLVEGLEAAIELLLRVDPQLSMCLHCSAYTSPLCVMRQHGRHCPTDASCDTVKSTARRARSTAAAQTKRAPAVRRPRVRRKKN